MSKYDLAMEAANSSLLLSQTSNDITGLATALNDIGNIYMYQEKYTDAQKILLQALEKAQQAGNKAQQVIALNFIASCYSFTDDNEGALSNYIKAAKIAEQLGDKAAQAQSLLNIGNMFLGQQQFEKARQYFLESLEINKKANDKRDIALCYNNIGLTYDYLNDFDQALEYYQKSLAIKEELGEKKDIALALGNIGVVYDLKRDFIKALLFYNKALTLYEELRSQAGMNRMMFNIALVHSNKGDDKEAINIFNKVLVNALANKNREVEVKCYEELRAIYESLGNYKTANEYFHKFSDLQDTIYKANRASNLAELQTKFDTDKKQKEIELLTKDQQLQASELNRSRIINIAIAIGMILALTLVFFVFRGYKEKKKANLQLAEINAELGDKNKIIEHKNKDITDSINYAQKIQEAILPRMQKVVEALPDMFVLFKPKDIVSGDFYWFHKQDESQSLIAAVDCTGHGVPGAFMSMIGSNVLNQIVGDAVSQPSAILELLHEEVRKALKQDMPDSKSNDGMDIALVKVDTAKKQIEFAGANRPLYVFRKGELSIVKPDKQSIGGYQSESKRQFNNNLVELEKGDSAYFFTDGYADQFGGEQGKKFMVKKLQQLLAEILHLPMQKQKEMLNDTIEKWRANMEQVDDILVIGIRMN